MKHPEDEIQKAVADQLRMRGTPGVVWWHTPNGAQLGGKRIKTKGGRSFPLQIRRLKMLGVRPGVSDIIAIYNGRVFALELKAPDGRATVEQMQFVSDINAAGGYSCIATGLDQAIKVLESWGLLRGAMA